VHSRESNGAARFDEPGLAFVGIQGRRGGTSRIRLLRLGRLSTVTTMGGTAGIASAPERARWNAYRRLRPLLFVCYPIAFIDRPSVAA
jgi:hypothetical protein